MPRGYRKQNLNFHLYNTIYNKTKLLRTGYSITNIYTLPFIEYESRNCHSIISTFLDDVYIPFFLQTHPTNALQRLYHILKTHYLLPPEQIMLSTSTQPPLRAPNILLQPLLSLHVTINVFLRLTIVPAKTFRHDFRQYLPNLPRHIRTPTDIQCRTVLK